MITSPQTTGWFGVHQAAASVSGIESLHELGAM
jgi:hypothetical protein